MIFTGAHAVTYEIQNKINNRVNVKLEADNNKNVYVHVDAGQTYTVDFDSLPTKLTVKDTVTDKERTFNLNCSPKTIITIVPYAIVPEGFSVAMQEKQAPPPA